MCTARTITSCAHVLTSFRLCHTNDIGHLEQRHTTFAVSCRRIQQACDRQRMKEKERKKMFALVVSAYRCVCVIFATRDFDSSFNINVLNVMKRNRKLHSVSTECPKARCNKRRQCDALEKTLNLREKNEIIIFVSNSVSMPTKWASVRRIMFTNCCRLNRMSSVKRQIDSTVDHVYMICLLFCQLSLHINWSHTSRRYSRIYFDFWNSIKAKMVDASTRKTLSSIPLLQTKAGPRDKELWVQRLKEEYQALIKVRHWVTFETFWTFSSFYSIISVHMQYVQNNKDSGSDWFRLESNKEGTKWFGKCWCMHNLLKYEFNVEFEVTQLITAWTTLKSFLFHLNRFPSHIQRRHLKSLYPNWMAKQRRCTEAVRSVSRTISNLCGHEMYPDSVLHMQWLLV